MYSIGLGSFRMLGKLIKVEREKVWGAMEVSLYLLQIYCGLLLSWFIYSHHIFKKERSMLYCGTCKNNSGYKNQPFAITVQKTGHLKIPSNLAFSIVSKEQRKMPQFLVLNSCWSKPQTSVWHSIINFFDISKFYLY